MTVKTITKNQYYQLLGLKMIAVKHNRELDSVLGAVAEIVDERDTNGELDTVGHVADAVYSNSVSVDELLRKLGIEVEEKSE